MSCALSEFTKRFSLAHYVYVSLEFLGPLYEFKDCGTVFPLDTHVISLYLGVRTVLDCLQFSVAHLPEPSTEEKRLHSVNTFCG